MPQRFFGCQAADAAASLLRISAISRQQHVRQQFNTESGAIPLISLVERILMYPAPAKHAGDWHPDWLVHEEARFEAADGTRIHGWYCGHPAAKRSILFCHGNGEHVAFLAKQLEFLREWFQANVLAFDYRGYGKSLGTPHETGILLDGEAAQTWLSQRAACPREQIICWGRSLGGAVAVHLGARHGAGALVLDRTFHSMVEVAAHHYPWLPVRWLLKDRYPSQDRITAYRGPLAQLHGDADHVVPLRFARALFDSCPSQARLFVESAGVGHNDPWPEERFKDILDFFQSQGI